MLDAKPAAQFKQKRTDDAAIVDEYVPLAQFAHVLALVAAGCPDQVPALQLIQPLNPGPDHVPATHWEQAVDVVAPITPEAVPAAQFKQAASDVAPSIGE